MRKAIFVFLLSCIISFCKFLKTAFPLFRSQQEATMRSERSCCHQEGEKERRNLSEEVDELRTKFQTMCSEVAEMKNMLADALNKINKENNDEEEVISHDDGPMIFTFGSSAYSTVNNDKAGMEDNNNNTVKAATPPLPVQSNFVFGGASTTTTPTGASPNFQFGSQQNNIPSPILFQASSGSQEFRGGGDSSGRKIRIFKHRRRK